MPTDDVSLWFELTALIALALLGFAGGAYEYALLGASRSRIKKRLLKEEGLPARAFIESAAANDPTIVVRASLLHSLTSGAFVVYGLWVFIPPGPLSFARFCWVAVILLALQAAANGLERLIGGHFAEDLVIAAAPPMAVLTWPFAWLSRLAVGAGLIIARAVGIHPADEEEEREAEVIDAVSDGQLDGVVGAGQKEMIEGIFELKDADVADIFVPRTEMTSIDAGASVSEAIALALEKGYSRLPAYKGTRDHIVGIFYLRDALYHWDEAESERPPLASLLRPPLFVPETKKIPDLLAEMRRGKSHLAVVVDEYGGTAGVVTMEDVLEEIVGDIQDEFDASVDASEDGVHRLDDTTLVAEGHAHVADVNKLLGEELIPEDDDYETVAGFVLDNLGHIPMVGESFDYEGRLGVKVVQADERRVRRVRFKLLEEA